MTFAGFFVHLDSIPPVLRWLQWFSLLKYALEALSVNEVGSGLQIMDTLEGVPVDVSAQVSPEPPFEIFIRSLRCSFVVNYESGKHGCAFLV
jgi:hypothetical protein